MTNKIEKIRRELKDKVIDSPKHWRILYIGRSVNGTTDIVSCMYRALNNLGHKVLNIDIGKYRNLTENPLSLQGGKGPIYVKYDKLKITIEKFSPQIIIFAAGGLTFTEEDFKKVRQKGILTLGMTLSDPDVLPTVAKYAHLFDFHTTNALLAIDMYKQKNIYNTLYYPFAIDRGYITQEVAVNKDFDADVICLGHATARTDRNDVMLSLAENFDVKTYGRGWHLPDSKVVEGLEQIQASRHGKCHINFAGTRAGYINIKTGVFETIANGALLCTANFDEMKHFFSYDDEILGWDNVEELKSKLEKILKDNEKYNQMVEKAFERLVSEHLYEHRWIKLFDEIEKCLEVSPEWMDAEHAAKLRNTLAESIPRVKKIIISGFYGAHNAGDELILQSISQRIEKSSPENQVIVAAENPLAVILNHGLESFKRANHLEADNNSKNASVIVLGGGGLWHDYTFVKSGGIRGFFTGSKISVAGFGILPLMGKVRRIPFYGIGLGAGPLNDDEAKLAVNFLANQAEKIVVRDQESFNTLLSIGVSKEKVIQAPDVVYGVELKDTHLLDEIIKKAQGKQIVGVNIRYWQKDINYIKSLAKELDKIATQKDVLFVGIPMQEGTKHDRAALAQLVDFMEHKSLFWIVEDNILEISLVQILKSLDMLIAMRLHACLLANRLNIPTIGLSYDKKVLHHFEEIERSEYCLDLESFSSDLNALTLKCLSGEGKLSLKTREKLQELEEMANALLNNFCNELNKHPNLDRVYEIPQGYAAHEKMQASTKGFDIESGKLKKITNTRPPVHDLTTLAANSLVDPKNRWYFLRLDNSYFSYRSKTRDKKLIDYKLSTSSLNFRFVKDAPKKGESVSWSLEVPMLPKEPNVEIAFTIRKHYENQKNRGWIYYVIEVDDRIVLLEDFALNKMDNDISIYLNSIKNVNIKVSIVAYKNCKSWGWDKASKMTITNLRLRMLEKDVPFRINASSPYSSLGLKALIESIKLKLVNSFK